MKIKEVIEFLDEKFPLDLQEDWDNSGLQIGNVENELKNIMISLDLTDEAIDSAIESSCNLIINHHPLIFSPIKSIDLSSDYNKKIEKLIKNDISVFAMHTNLDTAKVLELDKVEFLNTENEHPMARLGFTKEQSSQEFAEFVKEKLACKGLIVYGDKEKIIKKVALCGGAGSDFIGDAIKKNCDAIVTSDVKYHEAIDNSKDIVIIDPGHFSSENHIIYMLENLLKDKFLIEIYTNSPDDSHRFFK